MIMTLCEYFQMTKQATDKHSHGNIIRPGVHVGSAVHGAELQQQPRIFSTALTQLQQTTQQPFSM